jgi:hypothetical protein
MINLDLSALTVESFSVESGPRSLVPILTDAVKTDCCHTGLAPILTDAVKTDCCHTGLQEAAQTHERICTTV